VSAAELLVDKGSVAIDGVSLTVGSAGRESFDVFIIPETQERTILSRRKTGEKVNIEVDYLAKLVRKFLAGKRESDRRLFPFAGAEE
jgi:riboflavin synthase